jgi:exopolyphosphatase/guanosine-5'-triphosphate,3'-diphosphate pyrophosphatase
MKRAVIDLGTNSVLLLIGQSRQAGDIDILLQQYHISRLGERVFETGKLDAKAMERTLAVLHRYAQEIEAHQVDTVHLLGTEALRRAGNAAQFRDMIRGQLGWELQVISAQQEALYSFVGVRETVKNIGQTLVVVDVGGGSTEIIYGQNQTISQSVSLLLGVVELAEQFKMKEQLDNDNQQDLRKIIHAHLEPVSFLKNGTRPRVLIGVGGTITTLVAEREKLSRYDPERINGCVLHKNEIVKIFQSLNRLTLAQRRHLPYMIQGREDVILYGTLIYLEIMDYADFSTILVSDRGLRFGYFRYVEDTQALSY